VIITKGSRPDRDAYSGFDGTSLARLLHAKGMKRVVVCGLATDYCVRATAQDALKAGFEVLVLEDAIRGVEVNSGDCQRAMDELGAAGARFILSEELGLE
jgi:nicotinamidase-related amidase